MQSSNKREYKVIRFDEFQYRRVNVNECTNLFTLIKAYKS
jgi:hypothetical protein